MSNKDILINIFIMIFIKLGTKLYIMYKGKSPLVSKRLLSGR